MLDPQSIALDKWNIWCRQWFIPTHRDLNFINNDGTLVAKLCVVERTGEWPMWVFECIANVLPIEKRAAFDAIVRAWEIRIADEMSAELSVEIELTHRRSALLDN